MPLSDEDYGDIQGLVRFGYKHLKAARFYVLSIADAAAARSWLSAAPVTTAVKGRRPDVALHVAFTYQGLHELGGEAKTLGQFPYEFKSGMTEPSRARRLGDIGPSAPQCWQWGTAATLPDLLLLLYAATPQRLDTWEGELKDARWDAAFATIACLPTSDLDDTEPFGFNDGISQPVLDWERNESGRADETTAYTNRSALGEVLLGYPNEYGKYTDRPLIDPEDDPDGLLPLAENVRGKKDLGRNGTYLVLRDLAQDTAAFSRFVNEQATHEGEDPDVVGAALVGRVPTENLTRPAGAGGLAHDTPTRVIAAGDPLVRLSPVPIAGVGPDPEDIRHNQFTYHSDVAGVACPFGAHIRRANPRNADLPEGSRGLLARLLRILGYGRRHPHDDLIASTRFHRILRRGREYACETSGPAGAGAVQQGLRFICLNANISRQFEFVQIAWLTNPKFEGLDEGDPLLGTRAPLGTGRQSDTFTRPQPNGLCRRSAALPPLVHVRGGAYFFMPGIAALRYLSRGTRS